MVYKMAGDNEIVVLYCNILSTIIVLLSFFLKLPQIFKIRRQKTVTGISLYSLLLELGNYVVIASYNFANGYSLLSYLEYLIIIVQEIILIQLYLLYCHNLNFETVLTAVLTCLPCGLIAACIIMGILPRKKFDSSVIFCIPISLSSKALQLTKIWRVKSGDSVSVSTWFLTTFTNSARLYTIMMESADKLLLTNFGISTILAVSIMLSAQYFQNKADNNKSKKKL